MRTTKVIHLKLIIFLLIIFPLTMPVGIVCAKTQYVTDTLVITMREGKGNEYRVIKTFKTGTPLEIIEESGNYLKARSESGLEGWVLKQYLTMKTPKSEIITGLKKKIDLLNTKIEQYKKDNASLQDELKKTKSDHKKKTKKLIQSVSASKGNAEKTARELKEFTEKHIALVTESKNIIDIVKERDSLKASNSNLQTVTEQLLKDNDKLKRSQMLWWFVAGGGVFFVGWIIGKISRQKKFY